MCRERRPRCWKSRKTVTTRRLPRCGRFIPVCAVCASLDPACGSGGFLYVTLEHMKRLEGEVLNTLRRTYGRHAGQAGNGRGVGRSSSSWGWR
ncbi:MAG: DNA methyltransferase [Thiolinea sp.]